MRNLFRKKEPFLAPVSGRLMPIEAVDDPVFAQKMMGDGFAILSDDDVICAPWSGEITVCFPTNHAIGIKSTDGRECLLHIGIDTVKLNGEGFTPYIKQGQKITQKDPLVKIDRENLKERGYEPIVICLFPNQSISQVTQKQLQQFDEIKC